MSSTADSFILYNTLEVCDSPIYVRRCRQAGEHHQSDSVVCQAGVQVVLSKHKIEFYKILMSSTADSDILYTTLGV